MSKRRVRRKRRARVNIKPLILAGVIIAGVITVVMSVNLKGADKEPPTEEIYITETPQAENTEPVTETEQEAKLEHDFNYTYPYNTMSADWGAEVYEEGFRYYEIPQEYKDAGGCFPEIVQVYLWCECKEYGVDYYTVLAIIERESGYHWDKVGDNGNSKGKQYTKGRFYISPTPKAGFTAPRAFYDNHGIVQDKIYLSAFEGCIYDTDAKKYLTADEQVADFATDMLSSIAGAKPASGLTQNLTRANVRKLCANRGAGWESHSIFAMAVTEWLLMIEYASLDAQRKVGRGVCDFTDDGKTNMAVVTGATSGLGNGSGIDPNGGVDGKCSVSYRGEENLWGNIWTWLDKVNILAKGQNEVFVHEIGATVADDTTTGYKSLGYHWSHSNGYQSAFGIDPEHPELLIPTEASGSDVFTGNFVWQNYTYNGFLMAILGGKWTDGSYCGFSLSGSHTSGGRGRTIGGRLLYVPQTKVA